MASEQQPLPPPSSNNHNQTPMYPDIKVENDKNTPTLAHHDEEHHPNSPSAPPESSEEILLTVPGSIVHLIDTLYSVELACGDLSVILLRQDDDTVLAVLARVADDIQWPLSKTEPVVKLDDSHYFFSLHAPDDDNQRGEIANEDDSDNSLNYGLTIATKGQEALIKELDSILEKYSCFSIQKVAKKEEDCEVLDGPRVSPEDMEKEKEEMEKRCAAYWTTLAPNVEEYSGVAAKMIAAGSGQVIKGILWCGDVAVDRLRWGNDVLKKKMKPLSESEISPQTLKRIKRAKKVTKMTEKVATGVLSGVVKVSGFVTSSVANSKAGKKFFGLLPGEIVLASLDGFSKVCDAVEVAGKSVMSTSSTVTTGLVSHRYGDEAAKATSEGLDAAGHAFGTAWAVFKIRQVLNPKTAIKPSALAKSAAKAAVIKGKKAKS